MTFVAFTTGQTLPPKIVIGRLQFFEGAADGRLVLSDGRDVTEDGIDIEAAAFTLLWRQRLFTVNKVEEISLSSFEV